jgi:hypothetical protein
MEQRGFAEKTEKTEPRELEFNEFNQNKILQG